MPALDFSQRPDWEALARAESSVVGEKKPPPAEVELVLIHYS